MSLLADALKKLIDNPDDLSTLPTLVEQVSALEQSKLDDEKKFQETEADYMQRLKVSQETARAYLQQIPIEGYEPQQEKEEEFTVDDAKSSILNMIKGGTE